MNAKQLVLEKLKKAKNKGIQPTDFPVGFRLGARISDLRSRGMRIITDKIEDYSQGYKRKIARYVLIKEQHEKI